MPDADLTQILVVSGATACLTLIAGTVTAFFNHRLALSKDRTIKREELTRAGNYLAIRIVCVLDAFVDGCVSVVLDSGLPDREGVLHPDVQAPSLEYPSDVDWKAVDQKLMYRALALPNEISASDESISFVVQHIAGPPDYIEYFQERVLRYGDIGLKAYCLAIDFRSTYDIPGRSLYGQYDPKLILGKKLKEAQGFAAAQEEAQVEMGADMAKRRAEASGR